MQHILKGFNCRVKAVFLMTHCRCSLKWVLCNSFIIKPLNLKSKATGTVIAGTWRQISDSSSAVYNRLGQKRALNCSEKWLIECMFGLIVGLVNSDSLLAVSRIKPTLDKSVQTLLFCFRAMFLPHTAVVSGCHCSHITVHLMHYCLKTTIKAANVFS